VNLIAEEIKLWPFLTLSDGSIQKIYFSNFALIGGENENEENEKYSLIFSQNNRLFFEDFKLN